MKTEKEKFLTLLRSQDEKNIKLALQLIAGNFNFEAIIGEYEKLATY